MLNRLRQRETLKSGSMDGVAAGNFPWMSPNTWVNSIPIVSGNIQNVYDCFQKQKLNPLWRQRQFRTLNDVLMSNIDFITPAKQQKITASDFSQTFRLSGDNVGALAHSATGWYLCPPVTQNTLPFTSVNTKVASYLLQRAFSKMSSAEYDFGPAIGEIRETAAMLAGPLSGIVKLSGVAFAGISALRHDGFGVAVRVAKGATARQLRRIKATTTQHPINSSLRLVDESANHWLAYKFGVCPLIEDVGKVLDFAKEGVDPMFGLRVARVKGWKSDETVTRPDYNFYLCGGQLKFSAYGTVRTIDRHYTGIYWRNEINAPIVNFLETIGISPFQLPSLAYELIPLSFVVDRFIDIKSFVRGNIGSLGKQTLGNFTTRKIETIWASSLTPVTSPSGLLATVNTWPSSYARMRQIARLVNVERPNFPVTNPYWRQQLVADATNLSLIWGRLRTHVGKAF